MGSALSVLDFLLIKCDVQSTVTMASVKGMAECKAFQMFWEHIQFGGNRIFLNAY